MQIAARANERWIFSLLYFPNSLFFSGVRFFFFVFWFLFLASLSGGQDVFLLSDEMAFSCVMLLLLLMLLMLLVLLVLLPLSARPEIA